MLSKRSKPHQAEQAALEAVLAQPVHENSTPCVHNPCMHGTTAAVAMRVQGVLKVAGCQVLYIG